MNANSGEDHEIDDSRVERYFDQDTLDDEPALQGSLCQECGEIHFPRRKRCPDCFGDTRARTLSRTGTLYAFGTVNMGAPGFETPYSIGYVDLPEGLRIFSMLETDGPDLAIDREMTVTVGRIKTEADRAVLGYTFTTGGDAT